MTARRDPMYADFRHRTGDAAALLEAARIALSFYRHDMTETAVKHGCSDRTYPYGIDVESAIAVHLGEAKAVASVHLYRADATLAARPTRFAEIAYVSVRANDWRYCDPNDAYCTFGPRYASKAELLGDLTRFATEYGATVRR